MKLDITKVSGHNLYTEIHLCFSCNNHALSCPESSITYKKSRVIFLKGIN